MPLQTLRFDGSNWVGPSATITPPGGGDTGGGTDPTATAGAVALGTATYTPPSGALYVDPVNGSDSNNGTLAAPYATLAAAHTAAATAGTIVLRAGNHLIGTDTQGGSFTTGYAFSKQVTIQNYPGEAAWIDGSQPITGTWTQDSATGYWWAPYTMLMDRSPTFTSGQADGTGTSTGAGGTFLDPNIPQACWPDMIFRDGTWLTQVATKAALTTGTYFIEGANTGNGNWFQATKVWVGDNPAGHDMRYAAKTRLGVISSGASGSIWRGIGIRRYATSQPGVGSLYMTGSNITFENVHIEDMATTALWFDTGSTFNMSKITARRMGFSLAQSNKADAITFDQVDVQQCNYAGFSKTGPSIAAMKICKCQGYTLDRSIISNNNCNAIWFDQTVDSPHVLRSRIQNNQGYGVDFEGTSYGVAADLLITGHTSYGIWHNDSDQLRTYNCTLAGNMTNNGSGGQYHMGQSKRRPSDSTYSYMIDSTVPGGTTAYYADPAHQFLCHHFEVCNSVFSRPGTYGTGMFYSQNNGDTASPTLVFADFGPVMDGNVWHWVTQPTYPFVCARGNGVNPQIYFTVAAFHTGEGVETNGTLVTGTSPLNGAFQVTDQTRHNKAVALPTDIAALIGQTAGIKRVGAFLVGDPS